MTDVETAVANGAPASDVLRSRFIIQNGTPTRPTVDTTFEGSSFASGVLGIGSRKRRKRTNLEANQRAALDVYFEQNPHPSNDDIRSIEGV
ncbi:Homeobox protein ceh-18 [Toxocara canis]|uniref:Homeobox protein ceh-18 n=1 Tax=Toxocara canis TaxID=6265 RepID=A0A0B2W6I4_TOXCA|nr:Homeobox protein ceh-18 [Toxocara canis]